MFLAPAMFWGLLLAAVPLVIHLLARRRYTPMPWGAMQLIQRTLRKNRKRLRIEQWLLLIIRTLFIIALILAVARPLMPGTQLLAALGGAAPTARILLLDDSLSMGHQPPDEPATSAFDRARQAATDLIEQLPGRDPVTLLRASQPDRPLHRQAPADQRPQLLQTLRHLRATDAAIHWPTTFAALSELLAAQPAPRELILLTDLRRSGWDATLRQALDTWPATEAPTRIRLIDTGATDAANLSLQRLELLEPLALTDTPLRLRAHLHNHGPAAISGLRASLSHITTASSGDAAQSRPLNLPDLPPHQTTTFDFSLRLQQPGPHTVTLRLPPDRLPADNVQRLLLHLRPQLRILLVDGQPGLRPFTSATDFLHLAFRSGTHHWRVDRLAFAEWLDSPPSDPPDLLVLANWPQLSGPGVTRLQHDVRRGMGLMLFPGPETEVEDPGFHQLMPVQLRHIADQPQRGIILSDQPVSVLDVLRQLDPAALQHIAATSWTQLEPEARLGDDFQTTELFDPSSSRQRNLAPRVLARWNNPQGSPFVVEQALGQGRILLWSTAADRSGGDWPIHPTFVLTMREAAARLCERAAQRDHILAGQPAVVSLAAGHSPDQAHVRGPAGELRPAEVTAEDLRAGGTEQAGIYTFTWSDVGGVARSQGVVANPAVAESDLARVSDAVLEQLFAPQELEIVHFSEAVGAASPHRAELWRTFLLATLVLLGAESLLTWRIARQR